MSDEDSVRSSRDGDQFHYHWAAVKCLELLDISGGLVAVTVEGPSALEQQHLTGAGDEKIDVGLYYGSELPENATSIHYVQLKHSTKQTDKHWTASGLKGTLAGFAQRYKRLVEKLSLKVVDSKVRFTFTTNRPIDTDLLEALDDLATGSVTRHLTIRKRLLEATGLDSQQAEAFLRLFVAQGGVPELWEQRNLLSQGLTTYLPDADYDAPVQLKELVTRRALSESATEPSIRREDVLRVLKASEEQIFPAPCLINFPFEAVPREQEPVIWQTLMDAVGPVVLHADGGVGKSTMAVRLKATTPPGSLTMVYDCFGDGLYRSPLNQRHRYRDGLVQIANELAARGLCHPLIPTSSAEPKEYLRAFGGRLAQAIGKLRAKEPTAKLWLVVDAADNAEMAAQDFGDRSFAKDLIRMTLPDGVCAVYTCRSHRRHLLNAPPDTIDIQLLPFSSVETSRYLRTAFPEATDSEAAEFAYLSCSNPRVQALALSWKQPIAEMLKALGPQPTTVDQTIGDMLRTGLARLKDAVRADEAAQIDRMCQALAVLRPLVPIAVLARLAGVSESAVRSFALDLGRPLIVKGDSLHFMDEPAETWFREQFQPDASGLGEFIGVLKPIASVNSYVASSLPFLLLKAGHLDELVDLALSAEALPKGSPLERRDVELQRVTFALKACLSNRRFLAAAKLALKAGGESAGEARQRNLIQSNTDLAGELLAADRIDEIVSRRTFGGGWAGAHHIYDASLLCARNEFRAEALSKLRMAEDWFRAWARLPRDERSGESFSDSDRAEFALVLLELRGTQSCIQFLTNWRSPASKFFGSKELARRLIDLGRLDQVGQLAEAAGENEWILLALSSELSEVGLALPVAPLTRLLRVLTDAVAPLDEPSRRGATDWSLLSAVQSVIEGALRVLPHSFPEWASMLDKYLPEKPPMGITGKYAIDPMPLVRAYALRATLQGGKLTLSDLASPEVKKELEQGRTHGRSEEAQDLQLGLGGLLPWTVLSMDLSGNGTIPSDYDMREAGKASSKAASEDYYKQFQVHQHGILEALRLLVQANRASVTTLNDLLALFDCEVESLYPGTLIAMCRLAGRVKGAEALAMELASAAYGAVQNQRDDAEVRADLYLRLARAILTVSKADAAHYLDRAVEIASQIGDENLYRWRAFLELAAKAGDQKRPRPESAYRLAYIGELTYEFIARDKYFGWDDTVDALAGLCGASAIAILSRWRDRRFGNDRRLLPYLLEALIANGEVPALAQVAFYGYSADWAHRVDVLDKAVQDEPDAACRRQLIVIAYRYLKLLPGDREQWKRLGQIAKTVGIELQGLDRLIAFKPGSGTNEADRSGRSSDTYVPPERNRPDWPEHFCGVNLDNAHELRRAFEALKDFDPPLEIEMFFHEAFQRVSVGRRAEFVASISDWPDFDSYLFERVYRAIPNAALTSPSLQRAVREAVLKASRREPMRVWRRGWAAMTWLQELYSAGFVAESDVVSALLEGYLRMLDGAAMHPEAYFRMLEPLADVLTSDEADEAMNYGFDLLERLRKPEDADGPWRGALAPGGTPVSALAGYVWAGLGSPAVADRWESAHVVRSAVELDWNEFLDALAAQGAGEMVGPFVDASLEFYIWHARLWLLIGLARGGKERSEALRPFITLLRNHEASNHLLIRHFADLVSKCLSNTDGQALVAAFAEANRPGVEEVLYDGWRVPKGREDDAPGEDVDGISPYYFGIDIEPYWFAPLGDVFGVTGEAITKRAQAALKKHFEVKKSDGVFDARHKRGVFSDRETSHSHGSRPKSDDLRTYHAFHTMMMVASDLLKTRAIGRCAGEPRNSLEDWIERYWLTRRDGFWLSDARQPGFADRPDQPNGYSDTDWCWNVSTAWIDHQLTADDGSTVLWGNWSSSHDESFERISVRSAIVSKAGATSLLAALQTALDTDRVALPSASEDRRIASGHLTLRGWVTDHSSSAGLDEDDPWAISVRFPGPSPSPDTRSALGLSESADGCWFSAGEAWARSEIWTHVSGHGREASVESDSRLCVNREFVSRLLEGCPSDCLIVSVAVHRRPARRRSEKEIFEPYPWPYIRYYLMEADCVARPFKSNN